ncbi:hypothetical protein HDU92_000555 [Lobulomyces angularis]|nr:hypothetical protein HDU92_000555 [Lobulomyces angularis]
MTALDVLKLVRNMWNQQSGVDDSSLLSHIGLLLELQDFVEILCLYDLKKFTLHIDKIADMDELRLQKMTYPRKKNED